MKKIFKVGDYVRVFNPMGADDSLWVERVRNKFGRIIDIKKDSCYP